MNGITFFEWFVKILPLLKENAVIVMDNAAYHSVKKDRIPVMSWKKRDIINWLESKGENISYPTTKGALLAQVKTIHTEHDKYVIDDYAKENNKTVLRLPPYHCELNPIELAWSSVKSYVRTHNSTFKLKDVKELLERGVEHVTPEMWKNFVGHVVKEEEKFWNIDSITDDYMDEEPGRHILTIVCGTHKPILPILPPEGSTLEFNALCKTQRLPFVMYADFEALLVKSTQRHGVNTEALHTHQPMSYGFMFVAADGVPAELMKLFDIPRTPIIFRGSDTVDDVAKRFVIAVIDMAEKICCDRDERLGCARARNKYRMRFVCQNFLRRKL
ncbi:hypothetical protein QTP88_020278 [Uroleucon formosanum]